MSEQHIKMPASQRAKQFAPFDAVVGLRKALAEREKIRLPRKIIAEDLSDEINRVLCEIAAGDTVTLLYYNHSEQNYIQLTGRVGRTNSKNRVLQIGESEVGFDDICEISINEKN